MIIIIVAHFSNNMINDEKYDLNNINDYIFFLFIQIINLYINHHHR